MKKQCIIAVAAFTVAGVACGSGSNDGLLVSQEGPMSTDGTSLAAGVEGTFNHQSALMGAENGMTDPQVKLQNDAAIGSPEVVARLHGAQKVSYLGLGTLLAGLGVNMKSTTAGSAGALYTAGASALGAPQFASRVPEQALPSTSALAKEFDIFAAAASEIVTSFATSTRCTGITLVTNNQFSADSLTCLMGKPARQEHVDLANKCVTDATTPTLGVEIAIATVLAAAHTSE